MHDMFESHPRIRPIPQQRVIEKMDAYMARRDYAGAERHLKYWLEEARAGRRPAGHADGAGRAGGPLPQDRPTGTPPWRAWTRR